MKLIKNMLYSTAYQLLTLILPLITVPYVSSVFGIDGVGIYSFTTSVATFFVLVGGLGIQLYGNREIASYQNNIKERSKNFYELVILRFITMGLALILYLIFIVFTNQYQFLYLLQGLLLLSTAFDISWYFMGVENFRIIVLRNILVRIIVIIFTFTLVHSINDLWIYTLLWAGAPFLANLSVWPFLKKEVVKVKLSDLQIWRHLRPALILFLPQFLMQIYSPINKSLLKVLDNVGSTGFFTQTDMIVRVAVALVASFGIAFLPRLSNLFSENKTDEIKSLTYKAFDLSNAISILLVAGTAGVANTFAGFFFTEKFASISPFMMVESFAIIFMGWSNVIGTQYLLSARRMKSYMISGCLGLLTTILLNFILIPIIGVMGAIIATVTTEFVVAIYQLWSVRDIFKMRTLFSGFWKNIVSGVMTFLMVYYLDSILKPSILHYAIIAISGSCIYIILMILLKARVIEELKQLVKLRKKNG